MLRNHLQNHLLFPCHLNHPIYEILSSSTRREILRMLAYDNSNAYGRRLSKILNISNTAIHRHLRILQGLDNGHELQLIREKGKTKESYSGKKGGEATLFEIGKKLGMFVGIFPDLIHSHVFITSAEEDLSTAELSQLGAPSELQQTKSKPVVFVPNEEKISDSAKKKYLELYEKLQEINDELISSERKMLALLEEKNKLLRQIEETLTEDAKLEREKRLFLRLVACLGCSSDRDLSYAFHIEEPIVAKVLDELVKQGWLATKCD